MPNLNRNKYTAEERARHKTAYRRLLDIIRWSVPPDAAGFRRELDAAAAENTLADWLDWPDLDGWTLLHWAVQCLDTVRAGLPQMLIDAGADVNARTNDGSLPLGRVCTDYIFSGAPEYLGVIDALLAAGARPELCRSWRQGWPEPDQQARRDKLAVYIDTWHERRARDRAADAAPAFDYAL